MKTRDVLKLESLDIRYRYTYILTPIFMKLCWDSAIPNQKWSVCVKFEITNGPFALTKHADNGRKKDVYWILFMIILKGLRFIN